MDNDIRWHLLKFGGTSVSSRNNWDNIIAIIKRKLNKGNKVFIVHSALSGVSNRIDSLIQLCVKNQSGSSFANDSELGKKYSLLIKLHQDLIEELALDSDLLTEHYQYLKRLLDGISLLAEASDRVRAEIMSQGEIWATLIGQSYLQTQLSTFPLWLDARVHIKALDSEQENYLSANCDFTQDDQLLEEITSSSLVITQGFIGTNKQQETLLLGRGGSDTSASYFAAKLAAERLEIWTDVFGIFTANPNQVQNARLLKHLNYDEAQEMSSAGAKVLHPRAIHPVQINDIPIYIRSTIEPNIDGTKIHHFDNKLGIVKAITAKENITLISMESLGMWQAAGFLADLFNVFKKHDVSIDLVSTSETNVTVSLDSLTQVVSEDKLRKLHNELSTICKVEVVENCSAVSIVGRNVRAILHKIAPAFSIFETYKVYLLSQAASDLNLTFVIDDQHSHKVISALHELLISNNPNSEILGPSINELKPNGIENFESKWWENRTEDILSLIDDKDNGYFYDLATIRNNINNLKSINSVDKIFFAVKANNNSQILEQAYEQEIGFETVSIFEIEKILRLFPSIDISRIFFTPNFASLQEYQQALEKNVLLSLDSSYPLHHWPEIFADKEICLRIDPNVGKGHHEHVRTAGVTSKFGIPIDELLSLLPIFESHNITVVGLHAHAGSGILSNQHWAEHARLLAGLAEKFTSVRFLNLGGGFGIKERAQQNELVMESINAALAEVKKDHPNYEFWIEPGRYLVANSGVLVSKVTQVKQKQNYYYVGINTGMNSLMRPALYGAYHRIVNLTRMDEKNEHLATVVGPICESTDKLGIEIPFPTTYEGDIILIENTGAYGHVMSTSYNLRKPAKEYCI